MADSRTVGRRILRARLWLYAIIVLVILALRFVPGLRSKIPPMPTPSIPEQRELRIAGLDTAPELIPRVAAFYQSLYPHLTVTTRPGGTVAAVEDLLNKRADVGFMNRPLSAPEDSVVRAVGDSLLVFPVAVAGTLVLANSAVAAESLSMDDLRVAVAGGRPLDLHMAASGPPHVYIPDPALGLWGALSDQLGLENMAGANVTWVRSDHDVANAVAHDPAAIGFASALVIGPADETGCRAVPISAGPGSPASGPDPDAIAGGRYPLYHRLYAACRLRSGPVASAFVTYMYGEQGQTLVRLEGFLPAREIAREILLGERPVGMAG